MYAIRSYYDEELLAFEKEVLGIYVSGHPLEPYQDVITSYSIHYTKLYEAFDIDAKVVTRKNNYVVYVKEGSQIVDMLSIMEAHIALMNLENVRIRITSYNVCYTKLLRVQYHADG